MALSDGFIGSLNQSLDWSLYIDFVLYWYLDDFLYWNFYDLVDWDLDDFLDGSFDEDFVDDFFLIIPLDWIIDVNIDWNINVSIVGFGDLSDDLNDFLFSDFFNFLVLFSVGLSWCSMGVSLL